METIFINLTRAQAWESKFGGNYSFRPAVAGEVRRLRLRFVEEIDGRTVEVDPDLVSLQTTVGLVDARPTGGTIAYQFGSGASTSANTTADLRHNHTAAALLAALPAAVTTAYGVPAAIDLPGGVGLIWPADVPFTTRRNTLSPLSFVRCHSYELHDGAGWMHELRMVQAPLVQTTAWLRELPDQPFVETIRDGGADSSNTYMWSEIQDLTVPVAFRGTYTLRNPQSLARSGVLSPADDAAAIQAELRKIYPLGPVNVTNPRDMVARIEYTGVDGYIGLDLPPVEVHVVEAPQGDPTITLDFRSAHLYSALRDRETFDAQIEIRATIARDGLPEGEPVVVLRAPFAVTRDQAWDGLSTEVTPLWLRPPNPVDYRPFNENQVFVGSAHYSEVITGDGTTTAFVIDHGLDSELVTGLTVREESTPGDLVTGYTATIDGPQSLTITFATAPADAQQLRVSITIAGAVSAFSPHTHPTEQIEGLDATLEDAFARIVTLEGLVGRTDVIIVASGNKPTSFKIPPVGEILPDLANEEDTATISSQISVPTSGVGSTTIAGTELETARREAEAELARIRAEIDAVKKAAEDAAKLAAEEAAKAAVPVKTSSIISRVSFPAIATTLFPAAPRPGRLPYLLPAIHDTAATTTATLPGSPVAGSLYEATAAIFLPGGGGRKSQTVPLGGFFAYDGRCCYRVVRSGVSSSWHPLEMERELFRITLRPEQFPGDSNLAIAWNLTLALAGQGWEAGAPGVAIGAQYVLAVEALPMPDADTPGTPGPNLGTPGSVVTLASSRILLSPATEDHAFTLALARDPDGVGSGTFTRYGSASQTPAPPAGTFTLRARLTAWDVDDASADPRGQVSLTMPASQITITATR